MKAVVAAVAHATSNKPETNVPKNYVAAMLRLDATEWKRAVLDELKAMQDNGNPFLSLWANVPLVYGLSRIENFQKNMDTGVIKPDISHRSFHRFQEYIMI